VLLLELTGQVLSSDSSLANIISPKPVDRARPIQESAAPRERRAGSCVILEWVREDKFPLAKLVTNRYSLEQIEEARVALEEGQILGRAIIEI
jgi:hypothetical protein